MRCGGRGIGRWWRRWWSLCGFSRRLTQGEAAAETLRALTGESFGGEEWKEWMEWLGRNRAEYPPPDGYLDWKISLMRELDPRFARFLGPAREGAITVDPTEIVWGGVLPDGIPESRQSAYDFGGRGGLSGGG